MNANLKWLDDPEVFRVGQLPAHSDHVFFTSKENMSAGNAPTQNLDGEWDFCYSVNSADRPALFYQEGFDASAFDKIKVPCHIEMAGYDKCHYINTLYPWEGHIFRRPAHSLNDTVPCGDSFSGAEYNPVGSYLRTFDLEDALKGGRVCIRFEGVEQAMFVWLNGHFLGYAEDSFTPSEFDLTPYIREKGNVLAVEVHKRSTAAFLEDQDFFRFFGIFRSVVLYAKPEVHVDDIWARPRLLQDNESGSMQVDLKLSAASEESLEGLRVRVRMTDAEGKEIYAAESGAVVSGTVAGTDTDEGNTDAHAEVHFPVTEVGKVYLWDNYDPYLYDFTAELLGANGELLEIVPLRLGFRRIEIVNNVILLNGQRLKIVGVNRHEWSAEGGRVVSYEDMLFDLKLFRDNNINAVRTCHYPDRLEWYSLCDEWGIYMMAEANLETHGSWQHSNGQPPQWNVPGSLPQWNDVVMDREKSNFEYFKNHTSVLFWSLGNESFAGEVLVNAHNFYKQADPDRLVHYEGVFNCASYKDRISDVESRMYAWPADIEKYLSENPAKPFLLCEYMHDMGNSLGGMKSYMDLFDKFENYHGGFIWDYMDQALAVTDEVTGQRVLRYGGDFDDRPSNYEFSGNGILFADRTPKPALQEVKYYYGLYR